MKIKLAYMGDSITDMGRDRSDSHELGKGYPLFASELLRKKYPVVEFEFINLGLSGYRTENLLSDWHLVADNGLDNEVDIVSIMFGINDTWNALVRDSIFPDDQYEAGYREILDRTMKLTENAKLLILEQFLTPSLDKNHWRRDVDNKIQVTRRVAGDYAQAYIPTDGLLASKYLIEEPAEYYVADGVHPTDEGAKYIASLYVDAISPLIDEVISEKSGK